MKQKIVKKKRKERSIWSMAMGSILMKFCEMEKNHNTRATYGMGKEVYLNIKGF